MSVSVHWVCTQTDLEPWEEGLQGVDPGVHDLPAEHVNVNVEGWVALSFITRLSPGKKRTSLSTVASIAAQN